MTSIKIYPPSETKTQTLFKNTILFVCFWLCWFFVAARGLSNCSEQGSLFVVVPELLTEVASSVSRVVGLSTCGI